MIPEINPTIAVMSNGSSGFGFMIVCEAFLITSMPIIHIIKEVMRLARVSNFQCP